MTTNEKENCPENPRVKMKSPEKSNQSNTLGLSKEKSRRFVLSAKRCRRDVFRKSTQCSVSLAKN